MFESSKIKYLGLILDNKLNWKPHICELSKKLGRAVGLVYKVRKLFSPSALRSLYFSLFNSHLSYGLVVWGNASSKDIDKIKSLQRRAIKAVRTIPGFFDTEPILFDLKFLNFEDQYKLQLSTLMWDYDHGTNSSFS